MINSKKILSITHEQDVDGLFCGAILKNAFLKTLVFLTNHGHENMNRIANMIKFNVSRSNRNGTIVVSDMAVNNDLDVKLMEEAVIESKSYGWDFIWLDHHVWNEEIKRKVELFATLVLSKDKEQKCAAELIVERFALKRTACNRMANIAHIVDFKLPEVHNLRPLPELILRIIAVYLMFIINCSQ